MFEFITRRNAKRKAARFAAIAEDRARKELRTEIDAASRELISLVSRYNNAVTRSNKTLRKADAL